MLYNNNLTPQLEKVFQLASNLPQVEQNWLAEALTDWFDQDLVTTDDLNWETLLASSDSKQWLEHKTQPVETEIQQDEVFDFDHGTVPGPNFLVK
jgi:hypothetical protein